MILMTGSSKEHSHNNRDKGRMAMLDIETAEGCPRKLHYYEYEGLGFSFCVKCGKRFTSGKNETSPLCKKDREKHGFARDLGFKHCPDCGESVHETK